MESIIRSSIVRAVSCLGIFAFALLISGAAHAAKNYTEAGTVNATAVSDTRIDVTAAWVINATNCGGGGDTLPTFQVQWQIAGGDWSAPTSGPNEADGDALTPYTYSITTLSAGVSYDIRVVYTDSDGVNACTTPTTANVLAFESPVATQDACVAVISSCAGCHDMPPADWDGVSSKTGTTYHVGDHAITAHTGTGTRADCALCHVEYTGLINVTSVDRWVSGHSDMTLDIYTSNNIPNNNGFIAPYDKGIKGGYYQGIYTSIYSGNDPSADNVCTATYCHGAGDSPIWGSGTTTCTSCHNTPPAGGVHGTHSQGYIGHKDNSSGTTYDFGCFVCHSDTANHASGPQNSIRAALVNFGSYSTPMNTSGSYAEGAFQGTDAGFDWTDGTCSSLYCHSSGTGGSPNTTPTWNGSMAANCAGCHNGLATAGSPMATGKHPKHITSGTYNFGCEVCHNDTTTNGTAIADTSFHVNSSIDVKFNAQNPSGSHAGTTCSAMYCHGDGVADGSADWTGGATTCTSCHDYNKAATPNTMGTGEHAAHIDNGNLAEFGCSVCHKRTVDTDNATILFTAGRHVNAAKNVEIIFNAETGSYTGSNTCQNVYCHSSGQATPTYRVTDTWNGAATADCDYCHGSENTVLIAGAPEYANVSTADQNSFNSHDVAGHVSADSDCVKCHDLTVDGSKAIIASSEHLSGARDVSLAAGGSYAGKRCSNTDCHGTTTMRWGGTLPASCNSCHTDQGAGTDGAHAVTGKHDKHTNTYGVACEVCHATNNATLNTEHAKGDVSTNNAAEVFFNTSATVWTNLQYGGGGANFRYIEMDTAFGLTGIAPSYTPWTTATPISDPKNANRKWTEGRCDSVWCHSNANPMGGTMTYVSFANWSTAETTGCTSCHGGPGTQAAITLSETHKIHAGTDRYSFTCSKCHNVTVSTGDSPVTDLTNHVNKSKDIDFDATNGSGAYTSPNCSTLYCHGDGNGTTGGEAWSTASMTCTSCHDYDAAASPNDMATGKHGEHINNGNIAAFGCSVCHARTVDTDNATILYANGLHVDESKTVALSFNSDTGFYTASNTCRNAYCHSSGQINPVYQTAPDWTGASTLTCDGCHGAENTVLAAGAPEYANVSTADRNTFNGHQVTGHVSAATDCIKCHNATVDAAGAIKAASSHLDGTRTVSFSLGGSYDGANKRCSSTDSGCHGASVMRWGGIALCIDCHSVSGSAETDDYIYGNATRATVNFEEWTSAGHGSTSAYRYTGNAGANKACEDCHSPAVAHNTGTNPFRLSNADTNALCATCHTSASIKNHEFSVVGQGTWGWSPKCVDCHDPHGDTGGYTTTEYNGAMIHSNVSYTVSNTYGVPGTTEAVDFPANYDRAKSLSAFNWSSFVSNTAGNKGICRVCHTEATTTYFTRSLYTGTHQNDQGACTSCHGHGEGFKPAACDGCHGDPPNLTDANDDNVGAVGAHDKHVNGLGMGCYDCHKNNTHNQTAVSAPYTSIVTPGFVNMSVTSTYGYVGNAPSYNGTPGSWSPNKTCSNVGCHYGESLDWDCQ